MVSNLRVASNQLLTMISSAQESPLVDSPASDLDRSLATLETFLKFLGFCQDTWARATVSWVAFLLLSVALPLLSIELSRCSSVACDRVVIAGFELEILISRAVVAVVSLACVSRNLSKYGIRKALFVDRDHGHREQLHKQYIDKIRVFYRLLFTWFGICFMLRAALEITRIVYTRHDNRWLAITILFAYLISWSYTTMVFLSGCALFNLVGNLQVIHFENYGKVLENDSDISIYIDEHMNLVYDLSKISHRFRIFLLLEFLIVTASQIISLLQTTENQSIINFINGGDFLVLSIVQLVGIVLCITAAAKISHRAQSLGAVASRWHALVTACNSKPESIRASYSESDLVAGDDDFMALPSNARLNASSSSSASSYQKRQAFVTYVQSNIGGFTIFGWTVDRLLINTIVFIELNLVFFVLGKTITVTVR